MNKIVATSAVLVSLAGVTGVVGVIGLRKISTHFGVVATESLPQVDALTEIRSTVWEVQSSSLFYALRLRLDRARTRRRALGSLRCSER